MKVTSFLLLLSLLSGSAVGAAADQDSTARVRYSKTPALFERDTSSAKDLWKRKGGGRGSSGSSGSSGTSGSSSGGRTSSTSNAGGATKSGSGPSPPYRGGTYAGGTKTPVTAGTVSPVGRIVPFLLVGSLVAFWPGVWLYGCYSYPYHSPWNYRNRTSNRNETTPVLCGCSQYAVCGCDDNNNQTFIDEIVGNGSIADLKQRDVQVAEVNGTKTILINGTLPNGTTASGGEDDDEGSATRLLQNLGYWPVLVTAIAAVLAV